MPSPNTPPPAAASPRQRFVQTEAAPVVIPLVRWPVVRIIHAPPHNVIQSAAAGEALLRYVREPVIALVPEFTPPTVSIGYFQSSKEVPPGVEFVRRLTGGSLVDARGGFSLSTMVPPEHPRYWFTRDENYITFNGCVAKALEDLGLNVSIAGKAPEFDPGENNTFGECFQDAYRFDLMDGRQKIAASSLHKSPHGLMQEIGIRLGSLDPQKLAEALVRRLTSLYAVKAEESSLSPSENALTQELITLRYGTHAWNHAR